MRNRGVALMMGLVLLAAISLLALMAANGMVLQRRMSANFVANSQALAQAALATAAARAWLDSRTDVERESGCISDCLLPAAIHGTGALPRNPEFETAAWWRAHAVPAGQHPETGEPLHRDSVAINPPLWVIEEVFYEHLPAASAATAAVSVAYYRVLARGDGGSPGSLAVTESIVARPWEGDFEPQPFPPEQQSSTFCVQFAPEVPCGMQAWRQRR